MITGKEFADCFRDYRKLSECVRTHSVEEIFESVSVNTGVEKEVLAGYPIGCVTKGENNTGVGYYTALSELKRDIEYYDWVYDRLYDTESKRVFRLLVAFRFFPDKRFIAAAYDGKNPQYFDTDFVKCDRNEVFVDCGGYIGDTVLSYKNVYSDYKKCYIYEPSTDNLKQLNENLKDCHDIIVRHAGVGEKNELVSFKQNGSSGTFRNQNENEGSEVTSIVSLDEDIKEPVTFIKMDVEGFEIPAIIGAKKHIINDKPKLAICLYHVLTDIWEIPKLIDSLLPDHRFYIRHYMENENWETVLYAIPPEPKQVSNLLKTAVTIYPFPEGTWMNVELIKDCGTIPYLLHKNHGMDVAMVGANKDDGFYPYASLVEGMKLIPLPGSDFETKLEYLTQNAKDIDLLILRGGHDINAVMAKVYKSNNPNGLIYCGLDANSGWMDRIEWYNKDYKWFIDNCDVLATSCTAMAQHLTKKWHRKVDVLTNGFYDFFKTNIDNNKFEDRENVILTVARLGIKQKATDLLLEAFALISPEIPGWTLRLAGPVAEEFMPFREKFFAEHPELKERILFLGEITDRKKLAKEYKKAKIFALPSAWEGGTPNAAAEALYSGCVMAVTRIDAWEDCIGKGKCGAVADTGDTKGFAEVLKDLCLNSDLKTMSENAREYAKEMFNMEKNVLWLFDRLKERTVK